MKEERIASHEQPRELGVARLALFGTPIVFAAYALVLSVGHGSSLTDALPGALANTIPTIGFGLIAYWLLRGWLRRQRPAVQLAGNLVLCAAYAGLSYWLLIVLLGAVSGFSVIQFQVVPFPVRASVWQLLQNATVYGIIAALAYRTPATPEVRLVLSEGRDEAP